MVKKDVLLRDDDKLQGVGIVLILFKAVYMSVVSLTQFPSLGLSEYSCGTIQ